MNYLLLKELENIKFPERVRNNISMDKYPFLLFGYQDVPFKGPAETKNNKIYPKLYRLLTEFIKETNDEKFHYTSIIINKNKKCNIHKDEGNIFKSYIIGLGDYKGGDLMIENHISGSIKKHKIKDKWLKFHGGKNYHWTTNFTGTRYSIIYYSNKRCNRSTIEINNLYFRIRNHTTDEKVIDEVIKKNIYQKKGVKFNKNQVWLDLGGNIGTFAVLCGKSSKQVYSYEPITQNFYLLKKNVESNKLTNVKCYQYAVNHKKREVIYLCPTDYNHYQHSFFPNTNKWIRRNLGSKGKKFSDIMNKHKDVNCLKMDIEGSEKEILEHISPYLPKLDIIIFEWSFRKDKSIKRFYDVIDELSKYYDIKHNKVDRKEKEYNFYPEGVIVYCLKK